MSEFKYACPVCGQHIRCDSTQSGTTMECPTCFQKIVAPQAPATDDPKYLIKGTKVGERPIPAAVANAGVTVVSMPQKSSAGPAIVFVVLFFVAAVGLFAFHGKIFKSVPTKNVSVHTNPASLSDPGPEIFPANASSSGNGNNIALHKPALASSQESEKGNVIQNGNDGNNATRWCASNGELPQWWEVDLGGTATITNTQILWEHDVRYQYAIEVSPDHTKWTVVADRTANVTPTEVNSDDFSGRGRYVRIVITRLPEGIWASFYEFRVFGAIGDGGQSSTNANGNSSQR
ncbi:MAG: discoidin domain-containing protein [Verrucomicrobiia bacterium]